MAIRAACPATAGSNLPGFRTLFNERFNWFPFRVKGISPGLQSEKNLWRKYKDFEEAGWDIISGVSKLRSHARACTTHSRATPPPLVGLPR